MDNQKILTPIKAIRAKCIDCMCGLTHEVKLCPVTDCSLWPYRMGHNPNRKGKGGKFAPKTPTQLSNFPSPPAQPTSDMAESGGENVGK